MGAPNNDDGMRQFYKAAALTGLLASNLYDRSMARHKAQNGGRTPEPGSFMNMVGSICGEYADALLLEDGSSLISRQVAEQKLKRISEEIDGYVVSGAPSDDASELANAIAGILEGKR